jgi:hypothetical protein
VIKKTDWEAAADEVAARARRKLGEPPLNEELLALFRRPLGAAEAARAREFLVAHPELVPILNEPVEPPEPAGPGDPAYLTDDEVEQDWEALQDRLRIVAATARGPAPPPRVRRRGRDARLWITMAAAVSAVAFSGLWLWSQAAVGRLEREAREPRINPEHRLLLPDGQRGGATPGQPPILLSPEAEAHLLRPALIEQRAYPEYRLVVVEVREGDERMVWSASGLTLRDDDTVEVLVPRGFFGAGRYRLELYGVAEGRTDLLATYTVELARR